MASGNSFDGARAFCEYKHFKQNHPEQNVAQARDSLNPGASIVEWVNSLRVGDQTAARNLWEQYFTSLVRHAHRKLNSELQRTYDAEDAAISAFNSFVRGIQSGRFPDLSDPRDLWNILLTITVRKIVNKTRHNLRVKRGGPGVAGESALIPPKLSPVDMSQILGREPSPALGAELTEQVEQLWVKVTDNSLRSILLMKLESYTNDEIAERLNCTRRTVQRKLDRIRGILDLSEVHL